MSGSLVAYITEAKKDASFWSKISKQAVKAFDNVA
jgi:hypothetical protein